ncbi:MAG: TolC family protein [Bacteroidaceae bacterium]|nr:TolC family protein [Bacteroidaceae bacterium]
MRLYKLNPLFVLLSLFSIQATAREYTLDSCIELALKNDISIKNARIDMQMADEDSKFAFTKYFPTVTANATGFIAARQLVRTEVPIFSIDENTVIPIINENVISNMDITYNLNIIRQGVFGTVSAIQPVYAGGQIVNGNRLAALQKEVRRLQYEMTRDQVIQNVEEYYWQMVAVHSSLKSLDAADLLLDSLMATVVQLCSAGVATSGDLLSVELKKEELISQRIKVNNGLELLRLVLAQLTGSDMDSFSVVIPDSLSTPDSPEKWFIEPSEAAHSRNELSLAEKALASEELNIKVERGKLMPTVGIGALAIGSDIDIQGGFEKNRSHNLLGIATVNIPLSDWWGGSHNIKKSRLSQQKASNIKDDAYSQLQLDIRSAWNSLTEAWAQIEVARKRCDSSAENLRVMTGQYNAGIETLSSMLESVTNATEAQANLAAAQATYLSCLASYKIKTCQQ